MKNEFVTVRNTVTGRVGVVRRRYAEHAVHGLDLEIVPEGSKDLLDLKTYRGKKDEKPVPAPTKEDDK